MAMLTEKLMILSLRFVASLRVMLGTILGFPPRVLCFLRVA